MDRIKILISTDSAAIHSGLAETTRHIFIPLLQRYPEKYHIEQLGFFHFSPREQIPWPIHMTMHERKPDGSIHPDNDDRYGAKSFHDVLNKVKPDIVFGYGDMWHFQHLIESPFRNTYRLATYYTIDGSPYYGDIQPDGSTNWGKNLAKADENVVLSYFGRDVLKKSCPELKDRDLHVIYHALDMGRFKLYTDEQIIEARRKILPAIYDPDIFIAGWLGRNQFRKQNYKLWEVLHYMVYGDYITCVNCKRVTIKEWDRAARKTKEPHEVTLYDYGYEYDHCWHCKSTNIESGKPDPDFHMWLHMAKGDSGGYKTDLHEKIWKVDQKCIYTSGIQAITGISKEDIAKLIAIWDVMFYPTGGEGFGNPPFESLAAGTPVLYSNYSSHAEFCRFGGLPIRIANYCPELQIAIDRSAIDTNHAIEQFLKVRHNKEFRTGLGTAGRRHASQFAIPHITPVWDKLFTSMMEKPLPIHSDVLHPVTL